ncbi:hypothetical protein JX266_014507, partial [Neoarthrinium moseri]
MGQESVQDDQPDPQLKKQTFLIGGSSKSEKDSSPLLRAAMNLYSLQAPSH